MRRSKEQSLFDHLVGADEQRRWNGEASALAMSRAYFASDEAQKQNGSI
jgi:hypothetical protein